MAEKGAIKLVLRGLEDDPGLVRMIEIDNAMYSMIDDHPKIETPKSLVERMRGSPRTTPLVVEADATKPEHKPVASDKMFAGCETKQDAYKLFAQRKGEMSDTDQGGLHELIAAYTARCKEIDEAT